MKVKNIFINEKNNLKKDRNYQIKINAITQLS
jgi:hypothetical protein